MGPSSASVFDEISVCWWLSSCAHCNFYDNKLFSCVIMAGRCILYLLAQKQTHLVVMKRLAASRWQTKPQEQQTVTGTFATAAWREQSQTIWSGAVIYLNVKTRNLRYRRMASPLTGSSMERFFSSVEVERPNWQGAQTRNHGIFKGLTFERQDI